MPLPAETIPTPFFHQQDLIERTWDKRAWAVLFEQGTGKTAPTIQTAAKLYREGKLDGVVVVAPNGVHRNWVSDELPKHSTIAWEGLDWHSDRGAVQDRKVAELCKPKRGVLAWLTITYEGLLTPRGRQAVLDFIKAYPRIMSVVDEGSRVKNPTTKRTKKVAALAKISAFVRLLNGTPVTNSALDLYAQFKILDEDFWLRHGIASFTSFRSRFAVVKKIVVGGEDDRARAREPIVPHEVSADDYEQLNLADILSSGDDAGSTTAAADPPRATTGRTIEVVVGFRELDKLKAMIAPLSTRVTKQDAGLDLPPKLYSRLLFDLLPDQRKLYDKLRREFMVELDNGVLVTAAIALVRVLRLQQIACGYLPNPDDPEQPKVFQVDDAKNPRLQLLLDRLEDTPHPSIVWARFTPDVDTICRVLGPPKCSRYDGEVTGRERDRALDRFREGKVKVIVAKAASMGVGLTLTEALSTFYYSNTFSLYERLQSEDRNHRVGTKTAVNYYDLVASRTVDEHILKSLRECKDVADAVTGDGLRAWLAE